MRELNEKELSQVSGGKIEEVSRAPGSGQITQGQGEGLDTANENPAGHAPGGHNN
jgi:bacteriocin-like protein